MPSRRAMALSVSTSRCMSTSTRPSRDFGPQSEATDDLSECFPSVFRWLTFFLQGQM
jgi:hypothetical protein